MAGSSSGGDAQRARLKSTARRALADAWARGSVQDEANKIAAQIIQEKFPSMKEDEITKLIQEVRSNSQ